MTTDGDVVEIILERGDKGLGFNIKGGTDAPHIAEDKGIFITKIRDTGAAADDKRLNEGDKILSINGESLVDVNHAQAVNYFRNSGNSVHLKVIPGAEKQIKSQRSSEAKPQEDSTAHSNGPSNYHILVAVSLGVLTLSVIIGYRYLLRKA